MKRNAHRWLFASGFAVLAVSAGWLFVDARSPLALRAEIVESAWRVLSFIPLLLSMLLTGREHDVPLSVALPLLLCWWCVVGFGISHLIWRRHDNAA